MTDRVELEVVNEVDPWTELGVSNQPSETGLESTIGDSTSRPVSRLAYEGDYPYRSRVQWVRWNCIGAPCGCGVNNDLR